MDSSGCGVFMGCFIYVVECFYVLFYTYFVMYLLGMKEMDSSACRVFYGLFYLCCSVLLCLYVSAFILLCMHVSVEGTTTILVIQYVS